jgi:hypothetical protein
MSIKKTAFGALILSAALLLASCDFLLPSA